LVRSEPFVQQRYHPSMPTLASRVAARKALGLDLLGLGSERSSCNCAGRVAPPIFEATGKADPTQSMCLPARDTLAWGDHLCLSRSGELLERPAMAAPSGWAKSGCQADRARACPGRRRSRCCARRKRRNRQHVCSIFWRGRSIAGVNRRMATDTARPGHDRRKASEPAGARGVHALRQSRSPAGDFDSVRDGSERTSIRAQIIAARGQDHRLLGAAQQIEAVLRTYILPSEISLKVCSHWLSRAFSLISRCTRRAHAAF
jgi:hypothetical protein